MNTNSNAIRILCYGDSNTWGRIPGGERYPTTIRWTALLQNSLGTDYEIIEEGLVKRTTNIDDPEFPGKNGKTYLIPCLETHNPIDMVLLFLGTNDLKEKFDRTPSQIAKGLEELVILIKQYAKTNKQKVPEIVILSPFLADDTVQVAQEQFKGAGVKSKQLANEYKAVAEINNCYFLDLAEHVVPSSIDGIHLSPEDHKKVAVTIEAKIRESIKKK